MSDDYKPFAFEPVGVREFRENVATYKKPVTVIHTRGGVKVLGTWYPADWEETLRKTAKQSSPDG